MCSDETSFDVDVRRRMGRDTDVALRFTSGPGLTALFGPSGVGKSSVLAMVAGLLRPDAGHVRVAGETLFGNGIDVPAERRAAGYVFQDARLFPHYRVRGNLLYGARRAAGQHPRRPGMGLDEVVTFLGIGHLLDRRPQTLSGGEAQRVAIGRALLSGPRFLLMDEPLASLDLTRRREIMVLIERVRDELGLPILYVSHDRGEVDRLAATVVEMG
ncbi:ATP-binding cassette domain-containing protein [Sphingomonas abietis]|uniref:ATP-binding cassette domain-containing protein n=1 Tax=Sphingomonas abietis TaxID=3012344 RepID=A0ABY7NR49_9SPHN|nr:ATP-binding cassette domain-containing protein [Sphingomonas abietis]WBO24027.1 ATP-binding cassette domain-containing protein [Sphingomonas abietis]